MTSGSTSSRNLSWFDRGILFCALIALVLVFHNYALPILPTRTHTINTDEISAVSGGRGLAYEINFSDSEPNRDKVNRSGIEFWENDTRYSNAFDEIHVIQIVGGGLYTPLPGKLVFSTIDNSDPRSNNREYRVVFPILYSRTVGLTALAAFVITLLLLNRNALQASPAKITGDVARASRRWLGWCLAAATVQLIGLYCNTGTLVPYAITTFPGTAPITGYPVNPDHIHFRILSDFVMGSDQSVWDGALMLRRILFPLLAWPFIKMGGFEIGGVAASLTIQILALLAVAEICRRTIGPRGALCAAWLLAMYPGAAYWAGLPYIYSLIVPLSMLLFLGMMALPRLRGIHFACVCILMGIGYLGYDLISFFLPATFLALLWSRRWIGALVAAILQVLPQSLWLWMLVSVFDQSLSNSNSDTIGNILRAYYHGDFSLFLSRLKTLPEMGATIYFGANFIFLPALFLLLLVLNPLTSRVRLGVPAWCFLATTFLLFAFNHLAPDYPGWQMRGTWISRLYQPMLAVLVIYCAQWWEHLPRLSISRRVALVGVLAALGLGQLTILLGPILANPWRVSERAYYRFYDHNSAHWVYELHCLPKFGRRPLGFPPKY